MRQRRGQRSEEQEERERGDVQKQKEGNVDKRKKAAAKKQIIKKTITNRKRPNKESF